MLFSYWNVVRVFISRVLSVQCRNRSRGENVCAEAVGWVTQKNDSPASHCPSSVKKQVTPFPWWVTVVSAVFPPTPEQGTGPSYGLGMCVWVLSTHVTHGACGPSTTGGAVPLRQVSIAHTHASPPTQTSFTRQSCLAIQPDIIYKT